MANWLNHFVDTAGVWTRWQDRAIAFSTEHTVGGAISRSSRSRLAVAPPSTATASRFPRSGIPRCSS